MFAASLGKDLVSLVNFSFPRMFVYSWPTACPPFFLAGRSVPTGRELGYSICQRREAEALRLEGQGTKHCLAVRTRAWWLNGSTAQQRLEQMYVNADGQPVYPQAPSHTENILETKTQSQVSLSAGMRQPLG